MDGWDFVGHPVTDESAKEAIEQLKRQNDILTGIAAGNAGAEFVDAIFDGLLVYQARAQSARRIG